MTKAGAKKGTRARRGTSAKPHSRGKSVKYEPPEEEGCDDMTDPDGLVWSWEGDAETSRRKFRLPPSSRVVLTVFRTQASPSRPR